MKLIWHIVLKDLARLRRWLVLWVALYALQIGLGFALLFGGGFDLDWPVWLQLTSAALILLQVVTGLIALCQLVHEDRLIGTDVTWRTRPLSPARLLAAKLVGAGLWFGLLPVILMVPWWLACGFGWPELWRAALVAAGCQALIIVPAFWLASLTDTISRFLLWLFVGTVALITIMLTFSVAPTTSASSPELNLARIWAAVAIALATGVGVTVHQFLARQRVASVAISVFGLAAALLALAFWPWTGAGLRPRPRHSAPVSAMPLEAIGLKLGRAEIQRQYAKDSTTGLSLKFRLDALPENAGLLGLEARHEWRWPDGLVLKRTGRFPVDWSTATGLPADLRQSLALREPLKDEETDRWMEKRRSKTQFRTDAGRKREGRLVDWTIVPASLAQRMRTEAPFYRGVIHAALTQAEILNEHPLGDRSLQAFKAQTLQITRVEPAAHDTIVLHAVVTTPAWEADSRQSLRRWIGTLRIDPNNTPHLMTPIDTPLLVSRTTGEFRELIGKGRSSAQICGVTISWAKLMAQQPKVRRRDQWVVRYENWFAGTSVCVVRAREVARIVREVEAERFELQSGPEPREALYAD